MSSLPDLQVGSAFQGFSGITCVCVSLRKLQFSSREGPGTESAESDGLKPGAAGWVNGPRLPNLFPFAIRPDFPFSITVVFFLLICKQRIQGDPAVRLLLQSPRLSLACAETHQSHEQFPQSVPSHIPDLSLGSQCLGNPGGCKATFPDPDSGSNVRWLGEGSALGEGKQPSSAAGRRRSPGCASAH